MINLYSRDAQLTRLMTEAASGVCELVIHRPTSKDLPRVFDFVATWGSLTVGVERFAFRNQAVVVVLPEGGEWLANKAQHDLYSVVGTDYRKVKY